MLSWITLVVTLCCTSCGVIKGIGIYSQTTEENLLSDVQTLVRNFSYAMDLSLEKDREVYKTVSNDFANILPKCEIIPSCASSVIVTIVRGMYNLYSYVIKDQLSSGKTQVVTMTSLEKTVPWASSLLDLALKRPQIAIHMLKCYETTSALHLTAMFRMHVTLQKLLTRSTNCINSKSVELFSYTPLHISIVNRDVTVTELLLSHGASTTITDEFGRSSLDLAMNIFYDDGDDEMLRILTENKYCNSSGDEDILSRNRQNISSCHQKLDGKSCVDGNKGDVVKRKLLSCPAMASIHVSNLTFESFVEDYLSQRRPLLIKGAADHWKVRKTWSMQSLSQNVYSNIELLVGKIPYADVFGGSSEKVTLRNYLAYLQVVNSHSNSKNAPYYAFDPYILEENSTIGLSFYNISENSHPKWLINALMTKGIAHSFTNTVTSHKQFYMGPVLSGAPFHFHCDAINTVVRGHKRWFLLPPANSFYSNINTAEWLERNMDSSVDTTCEGQTLSATLKYEDFLKMRNKSYLGNHLSFCDQVEGDMIYIPAFWGHSTVNVEEAVGIAYEFDRGDC